MDLLKSIILGIVQGLTEFLPVSSSGHLEIGKVALQLDGLDAEQSMLMTVVLHGATALSTIVVFRHEVARILGGLLQFRWNDDFEFAAKILLSMIPAAVVGLLFEEQVENLFQGSQSLALVGAMLLLTGGLLFLAGRARETEKPVGYWDAMMVGIAQAIAILPGVSRSGATISTCVLLGIDRAKAARFSFLMVVPLIFGKMAKDCLDALGADALPATGPSMLELGLGFVAAFATGVLACKWMIALVKNCQLWWFSVYCFIVGTAAIVWSFFV